jgi:hypothetical protein
MISYQWHIPLVAQPSPSIQPALDNTDDDFGGFMTGPASAPAPMGPATTPVPPHQVNSNQPVPQMEKPVEKPAEPKKGMKCLTHNGTRYSSLLKHFFW